jgi:hypothetical protein
VADAPGGGGDKGPCHSSEVEWEDEARIGSGRLIGVGSVFSTRGQRQEWTELHQKWALSWARSSSLTIAKASLQASEEPEKV